MIRHISAILAGAVLLAGAGGAYAGGDPEKGATKAELCKSCHGPEGMSVNPECPNLAGQRSGYILKQVLDFQHNNRSNPTMSPMAAMAGSKDDIEDIAAYFSSKKSMSSERAMFGKSSGDKDKIAMGKKLFYEGNPKTGVYGCVNCHGQKGKGRDPNNHIFPVIGGQLKPYIMKQLKDFRAENRTNDPAGMMGDIASKLTDKEIEAVADYLSSL